MLVYILLSVCFAIVAYVVKKFIDSGFMSKITPVITESPQLGKGLTVYYKHNIGPYAGVGALFKEIQELLPKGAKTFGIYYDNPETVTESMLQCAVGVVFEEDGKALYQDNYAEQLTRCGFEKMVLPKVNRAVQAKQPNGGFLSLLALVYRTYGVAKQFIEANNLETTYAVEFYTDKEITLEFPLDNCEELVVPEYLTLEELETKMARKKFDSDEEDSESDSELEEDGKSEDEPSEDKDEAAKKDE